MRFLSTPRRLHAVTAAHAKATARHAFGAMFARNFGVRHKVVDLDDAVAAVNSYDTVFVAGFLSHSCPEALCRALGQRFEQTKEPKNLQLLFGGAPGDWNNRGCNHFSKPGMLRSIVASHYGPVPELAKQVLANDIPGYAIPLGAIARMVCAKASNSPCFITPVGLNTMVDPRQDGGALNAKAREEPIIKLMEFDGREYLSYPAIPINVAFIHGTAADPEGNITFEREPILGDAKDVAIATRSSGGLVICQVERIAMHGSLPSRSVHIPAPLVDMVVVADKAEEHHSLFTGYNPVWTGELRQPMDNIPPLPLNPRKFIARRGAMELRPDDIVNLGIGMPDGVASVASEEGIFRYVTLTTEAGAIGGVGATGRDFGTASNPDSFNEMSQQFDFYNGGGLNVCFLGLAQVDDKGNVNVSRLTKDSLTGPGGFIDISQSTRRVVFMGTFSKKGLKMAVHKQEDGSPRVEIVQEGKFFTFQKQLNETTFAAKQALLNGQQVLYVTERCVFELTQSGLELVEIAPGIDLEKDILAHMPEDCKLRYSLDKLKTMDPRIFVDEPMNLYDDMFALARQFPNRLEYNSKKHMVFVDLRNLIIANEADVIEIERMMHEFVGDIIAKHPTNTRPDLIINYDGFDVAPKLTQKWDSMVKRVQSKVYNKVRRYSGRVFMRRKLSASLAIETDEDYWNKLSQGEALLTRQLLVEGMKDHFDVQVSSELLDFLMNGKASITRGEFHDAVNRFNYYRQKGRVPQTKHEYEAFVSH